MAYKKFWTRYNANIKTKNDVFSEKGLAMWLLKKHLIIKGVYVIMMLLKGTLSLLRVEMMGLVGAGNNPMVGMTVAVAVAIEEAAK